MQAQLRAGRIATFAYFTLNGFLLGMWIVHIPSIEDRVGGGHALLGWLLLLLAAGAFIGMQLAGPLTDRFGARTVVPVSAGAFCAALVLPGLAEGAWTLGAALLVLGVANACLNVSMNAHAVQVERGYGRPVMSAFHATWSIGGVLASAAGARALSWDWPPAATFAAAGLLGAVVTALAAPALLRPTPFGGSEGPPPEETRKSGVPFGGSGGPPPERTRTRHRTPRRVWALALVALIIMLCEGVAYDWSTLHLRDVLDAPAATAALAYGAFATCMTTGRLLADRVAARFGPVAILRYGTATAALGLTIAALSPWIPPALAGWALFGAGLSGTVPQLFSAAGHAEPDAAGANVSRVAGIGYLGMLAGPAIIGAMTRVVPLNLAFFLPVACCLTAAATATVLRPPSKPTTKPQTTLAD